MGSIYGSTTYTAASSTANYSTSTGWSTSAADSCTDSYYGYQTQTGWVRYGTVNIPPPTYVQASFDYAPVPPETEEQKKKREEENEKYRKECARQQVERAREEARLQAELEKRQAKDAEERRVAAERAEKLLKEHIGLERYGILYQVGHIDVDSQKYVGRKYRVSKNAYNRIEVLDNGKVIDELCLVPTVMCPEGDRILSKIVLLECDEDLVLSKSNHFPRS